MYTRLKCIPSVNGARVKPRTHTLGVPSTNLVLRAVHPHTTRGPRTVQALDAAAVLSAQDVIISSQGASYSPVIDGVELSQHPILSAKVS